MMLELESAQWKDLERNQVVREGCAGGHCMQISIGS